MTNSRFFGGLLMTDLKIGHYKPKSTVRSVTVPQGIGIKKDE